MISGSTRSGTQGAGQPAQVDVQTCHEQLTEGPFVAHVVENHEFIVSIPRPAPRTPLIIRTEPSHGATTWTSSSVTSPSTMRNERKDTGPSPSPHSAVETTT